MHPLLIPLILHLYWAIVWWFISAPFPEKKAQIWPPQGSCRSSSCPQPVFGSIVKDYMTGFSIAFFLFYFLLLSYPFVPHGHKLVFFMGLSPYFKQKRSHYLSFLYFGIRRGNFYMLYPLASTKKKMCICFWP